MERKAIDARAPMLKPQAPPVALGVVRLFPQRARFVTGVAREYDDAFPPELTHLVKEEDFETAINQINNTLKDYWPCFFCVCCGYVCCPCTLGASLLCPNFCIRDATQYVRALIQRINRRACFARTGVEWRFVRSCGRSWIEISYPLPASSSPVTAYQFASFTRTRETATSGATSSVGSQGSSPTSPLVVEV